MCPACKRRGLLLVFLFLFVFIVLFGLPAGFFTPPDQQPTLWDTLLRRFMEWNR